MKAFEKEPYRKPPVFIMSGNVAEANALARKYNLATHDWIYLDNPMKIRGWNRGNAIRVWTIGAYDETRHYVDVQTELDKREQQGFDVVYVKQTL